jgi:15-cis-phytoene synthase
MSVFDKVFKQGSKTYFYSSLFFPEKTREKIAILYAFVRIVDNFVDTIPQDTDAYWQFKNAYLMCQNDSNFLGKHFLENPEHDNILKSFVKLEKKLNFDPEWTLAFFRSMEMDMKKSDYKTLEEVEKYIYGSAAVIGYFMAKILNLPEESYEGAGKLGYAFQYINFIRDIQEDLSLGRIYMPKSERKKYKLTDFNEAFIQQNKTNFEEFIKAQIRQYNIWKLEAEKAFKYLPKEAFVPIKTALDMYDWTAKQIEKEPLIVFKKKVKPPKYRILLQGINNNWFASPL